MKYSTYRKFALTLALSTALPFAALAPAHAATHAEQRAGIEKMEQETLNRLYAVRPDTRAEIHDAVGYAVFSSGSLAIIYFSGGYGHGIAHNNRTGSDTYMEEATGGVGLGIGVKDARTIFVFHNQGAFDDFINSGLDLSGSADAAAKQGAKGGAYSGGADVLKGVRVYQLTDTGLLAQAMLQGTKYWVDSDLTNGARRAEATGTNNGYAGSEHGDSGGGYDQGYKQGYSNGYSKGVSHGTTYPDGNMRAPSSN